MRVGGVIKPRKWNEEKKYCLGEGENKIAKNFRKFSGIGKKQMKPSHRVISREKRGITEGRSNMKLAVGIEKEKKERWRNYVIKPSVRRRYGLISKASALGGWAQKTMRKRWMQKCWRRRKKKRFRHSQRAKLGPETSKTRGFCLIRGQDRPDERVSLFLSQSSLHIIPTTRTLRHAFPKVTLATWQGIKLIASSDLLSEYDARRDGGTNNTKDRDSEVIKFLPFQVTQFPHFSDLILGCNTDSGNSNASKATSNPLSRLTGNPSVNQTHAITVNTCVSYQNCCCDKDKALGAKHSCPNVYSKKRICLPATPQKYGRHTEYLNETTQAQFGLFSLCAGEKTTTPSGWSAGQDQNYSNTKTREPQQQSAEQGSSNKTIIKPSTLFNPRKSRTNSQSPRPLFHKPAKKSQGRRHQCSPSWLWTYFFVLVLCNTSSLPLLRVFCSVEAAPSRSSFAPRSLYLSPYSPSPSSPSARLSTSARPARYQLIPPYRTNESITIYLSPPSIKNLRVNTRQRVSFNFTVQRQGTAIVSSQSATFPDTTSTSQSSPRTKLAGKDHADEAVNDAAPDSDHDPQLSSTTDTTSTTNDNNSKSRVSTSQSGKTSSSNKFHPIEKQGKKAGVHPLSPPPSKGLKPGLHREQYLVMIYSDNDIIARPLISTRGEATVRKDARGSYILMDVTAGRTHNFSVEARHIGRVTVSVAVVDAALNGHLASEVQAVAATQYPVSAVRGERTADLVFNISATVIAIIISFGIGAVTETDNIKRQIKHPVSLIIGFCCQFILMPLMAFGLAMLLPLHDYKDIRFGLLCVACVPGGGLGHVAVVIADGDVALSLTLNFISAIAMLGTAPLWIFVLGQYFQGDPEDLFSSHSVPVFSFEIWLVASFLAYMAGLLIKRIRPVVADAILMWLIKPFLLLASILYITLGVYINMYVFELVNEYALLGAMLLPFSGCLVGGLAAFAFRQPYTFIKTIALETSSLNCLVVMVALRYSLEQPDADLAAMIPIWVMFTIPGFFVFLAICNKIKNVIRHYWDNRSGGKKESEGCSASKAYSVSSSVVSPPGTTTLSAPLVVADSGLDDDLTVSTMSNQKVTVL